jgi:hypothetical protein
MTTVNVSAIANTVTVTENGSSTVVTVPQTSVVTALTAGPQGPAGANAPINPLLLSQQVIAENYTLTAGHNGLSVGDVDVAATYAVTVPFGANWVIV